MAETTRLTMSQAIIRFMVAQKVVVDGKTQPLFPGVWAIFGHGNVAGIGEALYQHRNQLPTYRAHNEQSMSHAAIAFTKTRNRRQIMACTASAGPGSTNMVTAAAVAHVNRLPVLFLVGDTFATRMPDPVLQQIENFHDHTLTVNDCFKPVSRFFDRITRPEQLLTSLPQMVRVLTDPVECGPVTLALPQDIQTFAYDYPTHLFEPKTHHVRRPGPDIQELEEALDLIRQSRKPLVIAGGGVHYSAATDELSDFVTRYQLPVSETQAGKGALPWDHDCNMGSIGVTGGSAANGLAAEADLILALGTRLGDFASGSRTLINPKARVLALNVASFDTVKHKAQPLVGDAKTSLPLLINGLADWRPDSDWWQQAQNHRRQWLKAIEEATRDHGRNLPSDAEVVGAVNRSAGERDVVVCAAGGLPGELQKLWRTRYNRGYHMEYGYSCMGYEIAGGLGAKMASPESEVYVMVGDGSYLMLNSELATSVTLGQKIIVVVLDNRGYGCIHRLQQFCGGPRFNNLMDDCVSVEPGAPKVDFAAHARSLGLESEQVGSIHELESALERARQASSSYLIAIDTDPDIVTEEGGNWWDVAIPEISERDAVKKARQVYESHKQRQQENL